MKIKEEDWIDGPPPTRGNYIILRNGDVMLACYIHTPSDHIQAHIPLELPDPPRLRPQPGWYLVRRHGALEPQDRPLIVRELRGSETFVRAPCGKPGTSWQAYDFLYRLPKNPNDMEPIA